jgi:DNA-binding NarL/FixJ family response regulator
VISNKISRLQNIESDDDSDSQEALSQREKEIVVCVVKGMTNKEIAEQLYLSIHTVITHRRNISKKLQIHSAAGLTIYAIVNKLVEIGEVKGI